MSLAADKLNPKVAKIVADTMGSTRTTTLMFLSLPPNSLGRILTWPRKQNFRAYRLFA
ncbi:hypothetical protein [Dyadobacter sp. CY326]|uniref:hypothetical protein n=1 Tax=Dyadobacter sp. CY326 TaxID=2907300 RepID=UPI001F35F699|nr:hypothetical protein [Dyadobacter sp. CY326]MCE7065218.1 hypothetical protein [Dyadobacter sp. CY326]